MKERFFQHLDMYLSKIEVLTSAIRLDAINNNNDPMAHYRIGYNIGALSRTVDDMSMETLGKSIEVYNPIPDKKD